MSSENQSQDVDEHLFVGFVSIIVVLIAIAFFGAILFYGRGDPTSNPASAGLHVMILVFMIPIVVLAGHGLGNLKKWHQLQARGEER